MEAKKFVPKVGHDRAPPSVQIS